MSVDKVLGDLRDSAALDGVSEFTLDREKARTKMRQFQLADPRRYVLLLVRAASLLGATRIELTIDADDVILRFDGDALVKTDFEDLYGALFTERSDARSGARRSSSRAPASSPRIRRVCAAAR